MSSITVDGKEVGKKSGNACKPNGGDYDCTFYDCRSQITDKLVVTAASCTMKVALNFKNYFAYVKPFSIESSTGFEQILLKCAKLSRI